MSPHLVLLFWTGILQECALDSSKNKPNDCFLWYMLLAKKLTLSFAPKVFAICAVTHCLSCPLERPTAAEHAQPAHGQERARVGLAFECAAVEHPMHG